MIKNLLLCTAFVMISFYGKAQKSADAGVDSLLQRIAAMQDDTIKVKAYFTPKTKASIDNSNKAVVAYTAARELANKLSFSDGIISANLALSLVYKKRTEYSDALIYAREALEIAQKNNKQDVPHILSYTGHIYYDFQNYETAVKYHTQALKGYQELGWKEYIVREYLTLANDYGDWKQYSTALEYDKKALAMAEKLNNSQLKLNVYSRLSWHYYLSKQYLLAMDYCRKTLKLNYDTVAVAEVFGTIGNIYQDAPDSLLVKMALRPSQRHQEALRYLKTSMEYAAHVKYLRLIMLNWQDMSKSYAGLHDYKNAYESYKNYIVFRDSINNETQQKLILKNEASTREDALKYQQQLSNVKARQQRNMFIAGIAVLLLLSVFIGLNYFNQWRSNKLITLANHKLDRQRREVTEQRDKLNETIKELKAAQQQLIQSEKMASLGELTAGIAHEIQNPLNFVNNFSEVSVELLQELKEEVTAGHMDDVLDIADDLAQNLTRIHHHGKRADGIVKGMLEHSRTSTGTKEPTDLNKLADEYLRLAYHGLRAKDKSFNADLVTNFDNTLPLINVIPQDIGRVMLNLFNNAFYAVQQKVKTIGAGYKPVISVTTILSGDYLEFIVEDNGTGIPDDIKAKVLQPFFTTKPTGEGTGLGLSLSYDIVVKGHGGSIDVISANGEGATFKLQLPLNNKQVI